MISYLLGASGQRLDFNDAVLAHFSRHKQLRLRQPEAGGQLFAVLDKKRIEVVLATGPRPADRRSRMSYFPNRSAEQLEINAKHLEGLHFIGDWHTHPQDIPEPSRRDLASMADCFSRSKHDLNAFVMVIVGRTVFPDGLHVSVHDGAEYSKLSPFTVSDGARGEWS